MLSRHVSIILIEGCSDDEFLQATRLALRWFPSKANAIPTTRTFITDHCTRCKVRDRIVSDEVPDDQPTC